MNTTRFVWALVFVTWVVGDVATTWAGLSVGLQEGNPVVHGLVNGNFYSFILLKIAGVAALYAVSKLMKLIVPSDAGLPGTIAEHFPVIVGSIGVSIGVYIISHNTYNIVMYFYS